TQLSKENRYQIRALLDAGHNQSEIARTIGVHRSTISRKLKRNVTNENPMGNKYCPKIAQQMTDRRHKENPNIAGSLRTAKPKLAGGWPKRNSHRSSSVAAGR